MSTHLSTGKRGNSRPKRARDASRSHLVSSGAARQAGSGSPEELAQQIQETLNLFDASSSGGEGSATHVGASSGSAHTGTY